MAWTEITTKDIAIQGEDFKYNCMASGTIKKGQALVNITDGDTSDIYVISSSLATSTKFVGVAVTDAVKGEPVAVYGQGAICWGRGDSALTYGDYLIADDDGEFDDVVCSMTVNTFPNKDMVNGMFKEASRVIKSKGKVVISLPHPLTLDQKTKFRWTEWKEGQTQQNLKPGETVKRKIMGKNGEMITVINYYWPPDF